MVQWPCLFKDEINITPRAESDRGAGGIYKVSSQIGTGEVADTERTVPTSTNGDGADRLRASNAPTRDGADRVHRSDALTGEGAYRVQPSDAGNDVSDNEIDDDNEATDLCCVKGFLTITSLALLFFVILPAGALVTLYSSKNNDRELLVVGVLLIVLPVVVVPIVIAFILNRRRIQRLNKRRRELKGAAGATKDTTARY